MTGKAHEADAADFFSSRLIRCEPMTAPRHQDVLNLLKLRYGEPIMNNVSRGDCVECMNAITLGTDWQLAWANGWDWAAWDLEHLSSGIRPEIKQATARQTWG